MLLSICGAPSPLSLAMVRFVSLIAEATIGAPAQIQTNEKKHMGELWNNIPKEDRKSILFYTDYPDISIVDLLYSSDIPVIVVSDKFERIVSHRLKSADIIFATKEATLSGVLVGQLREKSKNISFYEDTYNRNSIDIAKEIIEFYGIPCDERQWDALRQRLSHRDEAPKFSEFVAEHFPDWEENRLNDLSSAERATLREVAKGYDALSEGHIDQEFIWPSRSFYDGDTPNQPVLGSKLLAGPARCIFYGPYFHLPCGQWNCEVHIEVQECRTDTLALLDVCFGGTMVLSAVSMRLPRRGVYAIDLSFEVAAANKPVEIRLNLLKGAIEGEILLLRAKLSPATSSQSSTSMNAQTTSLPPNMLSS